MPRSLFAWYSLNELEVLGQKEAQLSGEIDLERLTRLRGLLHSDAGSVRASLRFGQHGAGYVTVSLEYEIDFELECQRCLEPMKEIAHRKVSLVVMEDESMEEGAPAGFEPIVLEGDRFQPAQAIEDELIVELPLVARHRRIEDCGILAQNLERLADGDEAQTSNPPLRSH